MWVVAVVDIFARGLTHKCSVFFFDFYFVWLPPCASLTERLHVDVPRKEWCGRMNVTKQPPRLVSLDPMQRMQS